MTASVPVHPSNTRRNHYQYCFHPKHHGADSRAARWVVTLDLEFHVFDEADFREILDSAGRLYGVLRQTDKLRKIGTRDELMAEFPPANSGQAWHGYPVWPLGDEHPENRRGEKLRPEKQVFEKLREVGLITERERNRMLKGDHV